MPKLVIGGMGGLELGDVVAEKARRANESLALYRAMPSQMPFHESDASERVLRGGNQSGKSTSAAAEFASAATGQAILGADGRPIRHKFPTNCDRRRTARG